jgi:hypothetical protein
MAGNKRAPTTKEDSGIVRRVFDRVLRTSMSDLAKEYREDRERQAEELFNRIYHVVQDVQPDAATLLFVLREIEFVCLMTETNQRLGPGAMIVKLPDDARRRAAALKPQPTTGPAKAPEEAKTASAVPQAIG